MTVINVNQQLSVGYKFNPKQQSIKEDYPELKIKDQNIAFFDEVLNQSFKFYDLKQDGWLLVFFEGSDFQKVIEVKFANEKQEFSKNNIGTAYYFSGKAVTEESIEYAKSMLQSKSLTQESFARTSSSGFVASVRRGFVYITETPGQFERAVILNGLAHAYKLVMKELFDNARKAILIKDDKKLFEAAEKGFYFNVAFYSIYPIKLENEEIRKFWEVFEKQWQISKQNDELVRQLDSIQTLLQFKENLDITKKHQQQSIRLTKFIAVAGVIFALVTAYLTHLFGWNT